MCPQGVYPAGDVCAIGDEISSTGEGRHITLYADNLEHGSVKDYVTKGYPVWWGDHAVGVAFNTQPAGENPLIAVDTEGIWCQDVYAHDEGGDVDVVPGDLLFINETTGLISKIANAVLYGGEYSRPFGYALGTISAGDTDRIAVKTHWNRKSTLLDGEVLYFGDDKDIAIYFTGTQLNIITGSGGGGQLVELQGLLTVAGTFTCNAAGVFGGSLTAGSMVCNGNIGIGGECRIAALLHITNPPIADPSVAGQVWDNAGVLTRSHG